MRRFLLIILIISAVFAGLFCTAYQNAGGIPVKGDIMNDKKILTAYFSKSGNTEYIAQKISQKINTDLFRIETKIPYPEDYHETAYGIAKEQHDKGIKPELKDNGNTADYDVIFIGTPVWWHTIAPPVKTFLSENNFEGKKIVPFITHGGGGEYNIAQEIGEISHCAEVLTPLVIYEKGNSDTGKEIDKWLNGLKY